jgi:pimeloyl-ACP methyl ester carboxylesterase
MSHPSSSGDASVHVTRWGTSGPRVILVHGGVQGAAVGGDRHFSVQATLANDGWRLLVPDRPGHGQSPRPGRPDDAALDAVWLADMLEEGAHLVGHSYGGCVTLAATALRPDSVRSLTLIEPAMLALSLKDRRVLSLVLRILAANLTSLSAARYAKRFAGIFRIPPEIRGESSREELQRMGEATRSLRVVSQSTLVQQLDAVRRARIPLLVVSGGWSPAFEATSDAVAARGGGRRLVIPSPHHFPQLVSGAFNEALAAFMRDADAHRVPAT